MASAGNGVTLTTTGVSGSTVIFSGASDGGPCQVFSVANRSGSSGNVLVNIPGLHKTGEWIGIAPGAPPMLFCFGLVSNGIQTVNAETDTGTATIDFGIAKKV